VANPPDASPAPFNWDISSGVGGEKPTPVPYRVGSRVGDYVLEEALGRGGMGSVFRGRHVTARCDHAVKLVFGLGAADDTRGRQRFEREGLALAALRHPGVVRVHQCQLLPDGVGMLSMELVEGSDLRTLLRQQPGGRFAWSPAMVRIAAQLAEALAYLHTQGITHRDVKPPNVLLRESDRRAVLCDFGLAKAPGDERLTHTGQWVGTPRYMAPEQVVGEPAGPPADVYAWAATVYRLLTGEYLFDAETVTELSLKVLRSEPRPLAELCPEVPAWFATLVHDCLAKDAPERPSAEVLVARLEAGEEGSVRSALASWQGGALAGAVALALLGALWLVSTPSSPSPSQPSPSVAASESEGASPPPSATDTPAPTPHPGGSAGVAVDPPVRQARAPTLDALEEHAREGDIWLAGELGRLLVEDHQDYPAGLYWTRVAAEAGEVHSIGSLGKWYKKGEAGLEPDPEAARYWLEKGAPFSGYCAYQLSVAYRDGTPLAGGARDDGARWRYLELAVQLGDADALYERGRLHDEAGEWEEAVRLLERAADEPQSPRPEGWLRLGQLFAQGLGTEPDLAAARYRFQEVVRRWPEKPQAEAARQELERLGGE
jgi:serine/threonine protein kinase